MKRAVTHWDRTYAAPFVMYFHTWELDPAQPKLNGVPFLSRVRQYRNLEKMAGILHHYLTRYQFSSIADYLGLDSAPVAAAQPVARSTAMGFPVTDPDPSLGLEEIAVPNPPRVALSAWSFPASTKNSSSLTSTTP